MLWIILIIVGALLIKLGALTVIASLLAMAFKVAIGVIAAIGLLILWIELRKP
jgi:hypothetical protein